MASDDKRPGIYNVEYFSGTQAAVYIGDIWIDEITSISYAVHQSRTPLYGYASQLFDDVSKGPVIVQGEFTINFKEAGYLWLVLDRYQRVMKGAPGILGPFSDSARISVGNIEQITDDKIKRMINGQMSIGDRTRYLQDMAGVFTLSEEQRADTAASLRGYASNARAEARKSRSENKFEVFEDAIWGAKSQEDLDNQTRRADDHRINPFDIYIAFGDFAGDNRVNHTIQKISEVYILGSSKRIVVDGQPIQEAYSFIGRNLV